METSYQRDVLTNLVLASNNKLQYRLINLTRSFPNEENITLCRECLRLTRQLESDLKNLLEEEQDSPHRE